MRSGVGAFWPRAAALDFFLFLEVFVFLFTDDCAAAALPAAETTGSALTRSTAPKAQSQILLIINVHRALQIPAGFK